MTTTALMNSKIDAYQNSISSVQGNKEKSPSGFDSILKEQAGNLKDNDQMDVTKKVETTDTKKEYDNTISKSENINNEKFEDSNIKEFDESKYEDVSNDVLEEEEMIAYAESVVGSLLTDIASVLQVSVEEVNQLLENLGMEVTELLDASNLTKFILAFNGSSDPLELTTNQDLYSMLQELTDLMEEVKEEVEQSNYSMDDITQLLQESDMEIMTSPSEVEDANEELSIDSEESNGQENLKTEEDVEIKITKHAETGSEQGYSNEQTSNFEFLNQNQQQAVTNASAGQVESTTFTTSQSNQIMNQIFDQMTSNLKSEVTEIEMQLNPESLGKVNVHLLSQEGAITARFTAENEMVKALLENQMVQLKDNFAQQGLKVSAVEVAVEYQGFQENKQPQEDRTSQEKKNRSKSLSIDGELEDEVYTEEEQLAVQMMNDNGNSVDYVV